MNNGTRIGIKDLQYRKKENWFKELLYKLHILKPKYVQLKGVKDITIKQMEKSNENN